MLHLIKIQRRRQLPDKWSKKTKIQQRKKLYQRPLKKLMRMLYFLNKYLFILGADWLEKQDDVKFVKQVPLHPQERLKRKRNSTTLDDYNTLSKNSKNEDVTFIKQVLLHLRKPLERLAKIDVHFIKRVASTKPKKTCSDKKKNL